MQGKYPFYAEILCPNMTHLPPTAISRNGYPNAEIMVKLYTFPVHVI